MMDAETKQGVRARLRRITGQVEATERMVDEVVLRSHVETCATDAIRSGDDHERMRKVDELMIVFSRYGQARER